MAVEIEKKLALDKRNSLRIPCAGRTKYTRNCGRVSVASKKRKQFDFIKLNPILEIIRAAIWTARLSDEKPVSIMLVAEQESAKTECLKYFRGTSTLHYVSDITSRGLKPYKSGIESGKLRHLVILDLVRIVSHGRNVSDRTLQTLASLMEEGESETSDAGGTDSWANFPRIGVLMAITPAFFRAKRGKWRETGFLTRFVPVSFEYSSESVREIHTAISNGFHVPPPHPEVVAPGVTEVRLSPAHAKILAQKAQALGEAMGSYGFRYQRVLRALAKGQARQNRRYQVSDADIVKVMNWSEFLTEKAVVL